MEATPEGKSAAVLDACVLAPMPLCDLLLRCAEAPAFYRPVWSSQILNEVARTLCRFGYGSAQANRRIAKMQEAFPEATITVPRRLIAEFSRIPDPDDRHVAAAAAAARVQFLVTFNIRHFPQAALDSCGVIVYPPDPFLCRQLRSNPARMIDIVREQALAIGQDPSAILMRLKPELPEFVRMLAPWAE